jgi:hypothetical protein
MATTILSFRRNTYARNIYLYGTTNFLHIQNTAPEYEAPVKEYAAVTFSQAQIDNALAKGWITQAEFDETMAFRPPAPTA